MQITSWAHMSAVIMSPHDFPCLEHIIDGIGSSITGMQNPGDVAFHTVPHQLQHGCPSHSTTVVALHVSLGFGAGGTSVGASSLISTFSGACAPQYHRLSTERQVTSYLHNVIRSTLS